jgi:oligopeptidase B
MKALYLFTLSTLFSTMTIQAQNPPVCKQIPHEMTIHGDTRVDKYYWLNDYWLNGPLKDSVVEYLNAENAYQESVMAPTKDLQEKLYNEMLARIKQTDESVPYFYNGYWYITKTEEAKEYPIYVRRKGSMDAPEELLLDVNQMAEGYEYYSVSGLTVSPDNTMLAFGVDTVSRRQYTIYFKNLLTGQILAENIPNTSANIVWAKDSKTVFYSTKDELTLRNDKVWRYEVGAEKAPELVFLEKDETFVTFVGKTKSEAYITILSYSTLSSELRFIPSDQPKAAFTVLLPRESNHLYMVDHFGDNFYIRTNWQAQNFRLMKAPAGKSTPKEQWQEVVAHRPDVLLEGMEIFEQHLVLTERSNALTGLRIIPWEGAGEHYIQFAESAYVAGLAYNPDFHTQKLRYTYTSMTTPSSQYEYDMVTRQQVLLKRQEVLGGYDPANYRTERLWATARDGVKVPISIVYHKDFKKDGTQPLLLYGYGSYGASTDPYFSSMRLSLLDRGFAFAIAHIRGGEEMGRQWYEDGKMFKKMNTFTDFIDCAEFLIAEKYTSKGKLYAYGGSAGGLLMGAVVNLRPDLWNGVISAVPFVDVVTTMLDERIPLTTGEYDEWGNPNNKDSYFYMKSYSPYDNIEAKAYPNMLITTGLHDSQVQYFEPAKYVAKLREMKTDNNILIMHCDMSTGHGGSSGRFKRLREVARDYAFLLMLEGITQ